MSRLAIGLFAASAAVLAAKRREHSQVRPASPLDRWNGPRHRPTRRKPPEADMPVPAIPPNGPLPLHGGAEAPLDYST